MGFVVYPRSQQYIPGINCSFHRGSRMAETTFCPVTRIFQETVCRRVKRSQVMLCFLLAGSFTKCCPLEIKHLQRMRENGSCYVKYNYLHWAPALRGACWSGLSNAITLVQRGGLHTYNIGQFLWYHNKLYILSHIPNQTLVLPGSEI